MDSATTGLRWMAGCCLLLALCAGAQAADTVVDLPTRPGVTQRMLVVSASAPASTSISTSTPTPAPTPTPTPTSAPAARGVMILFAGGHGGLQLTPGGAIGWGRGNFLVRTRQQFADRGMLVALVDAPSDRQREPFLTGFRQTPEHAADIRAVIAWARKQAPATADGRADGSAWPVWLVGTSRGTQSAAYIATALPAGEGPDGLVLTSTILDDTRMLPVPALALEKLRMPVVVVHHALDGCRLCNIAGLPRLMAKLGSAPATLIEVQGGESRGDPCEAFAYHGFNGIEQDVVDKIVKVMLAAQTSAGR